MMRKMKRAAACAAALLLALWSVGCDRDRTAQNDGNSNATGTPVESTVSTDSMNFSFTDRDMDGSYDENATVLTGASPAVTSEGVYILTGSYSSVTVDAPDSAKIQLVLKNAEITNDSGPAIYIRQADKVFLTLAENSQNTLTDGESYDLTEDDANLDAALFSRADLTVNGSGRLTVNGNYKSAIVSKDDLVITDGEINATSLGGCAIDGKDCVKLAGGHITVTSAGDGIRSDNSEDTSRGYVYIAGGQVDITAENDAVQAETVLYIAGGTLNMTTGGGSAVSSSGNSSGNGEPGGFGGRQWGSWGNPQSTDSTESAKGLKAGGLIRITGAEIGIDASDDAIHSNGDAEISGGTLTLASGDDGIHADGALIINDGTIEISKSYEGLEGTTVTVTGGNINLTASDDGINAAGGNDSSSLGGRPGQNMFDYEADARIEITGGYITANAAGDGIDSNGDINMTGGILLVSGPTDSGNGALDYGGAAVISGGVAILTGSSGMAEGFSGDSEQCSVMYTLSSSAQGGTSVILTDSDGNVLAGFLPGKQYNNIVISTPKLSLNGSYRLVIGGTVDGCDPNGYAESGSVTGEGQSYDITVSSVSTVYGGSGMGGPGGMGGGMGGPGGMGGGPGQRR